MAINTTIASLSQTAASNGPDGASDPPSTIDDALRYHGAFIAQLRDTAGSLSGAVGNTSGGTLTLTATNTGNLIVLSGVSVTGTCVLPLLSSVVEGGAFIVKVEAVTSSWTLQTNATDGSAMIVGSSSISSIALGAGESLVVVKNGSIWRTYGTADLRYSAAFGNSPLANGYQRLPGGLLECRGAFVASATPGAPVAVTFPLAFTQCFQIVLTAESGSATTVSAWYDSKSGTGFNGRCSLASGNVSYIAKGI